MDGTVVRSEYGWSWSGGIKGREEALRGRNSRIASSLEIVPRERLLLGLVGVGEGEVVGLDEDWLRTM